MGVTAPEGASVAAMDDVMRAIEGELKQIPAIRTVLTTIAGGPFSTVNEGAGLRQDRAARRADLLAAAAAQGHRHARSAGGVPRQLLAGAGDAADSRAHAQVHAICASACATCRRSTSAAAIARSTSRSAARSSSRWRTYSEKLREQSRGARHHRRRHHAQAGQAGAAGAHRSRARRRPRREHAGRGGGAAADGRRRSGGDALPRSAVGEDYDVQLRLVDEDRRDPRYHFAPLRVAQQRRDGASRLGRQPRGRQSPSRVDRLDRQRQANLRAGVAPGYALADRLEALRDAAATLGMPAGLHAPRSAAAAASSSAPSPSSAGRSCCRSRSCTWCWRRSTRAC